eukprot:scaffold25535_cov117-Cylindrotheca_fusiformis.AAC.2
MRRLLMTLATVVIQAAISESLYIRGTENTPSSLNDAAPKNSGRRLDEDELQYCYDALFVADEDGDRNINREEYVSFVEALGGPGVSSFNDLPIVFKSSFSVLACRCVDEPGAQPDCCVGGKAMVSNIGAAPGDNPTPQEEQNLYHICFLSESSVQKFNNEEQPTAAPTSEPGDPTTEPTIDPTGKPSPAPADPPTLQPTLAPNPFPSTDLPTLAPTPPPSDFVSGAPTIATSGVPTVSPTTAAPTFQPSVGQTENPTLSPTAVPTGTPSTEPTVGPTATPSDFPTITPTISPAPTITAAPTNVPSVSPSQAPTNTSVATEVTTSYEIAVRGGAQLNEYEGDLIESMNMLASEVASNITDAGRRRLVSVSIDSPTLLTGVEPTDCPGDVGADDRCETVNAAVRLFVDETDDEEAVATQYKEALNTAIESGELQRTLDFVNDESVVYILTGRDTGRGIESDPDSSLSAGAITGIVAVGLVGLVCISLLLTRGRDRGNDDPGKQEDYMVDLEGIQPGTSNDPNVDNSDGEGKKKSNKSDESSNAGDSGWSSHGGLSSLDTSSMDDEQRSKAVAMGTAGAALARRYSDSSGNLNMTYTELDDAIQKGDWAAVGVTAALLASQSYETGASTTDTHRRSVDSNTLNPSRAAELDRLVEAGDWEGVVAAAAKFDAQEATHRPERAGSIPSKEGSSSDATSGASGSVDTGSPASSVGSGSRTHFTTGTTTDSNSQSNRKLEEIRKEVEELVQQVVPEEQNNVDEMMLQFQGREEELVETLRSMQERQVVQKARVEGQKKAKRDARENVQFNKRELAEKAAEGQAKKEAQSLGTGEWGGNADAESGSRREQDLKDEEDARAQAAQWEAVAQQTRNQDESGGNDDTAAKDAADWAIAQSLNQLSGSAQDADMFEDDEDEEGSV